MKIIDLLVKISKGEEVPDFYYDNNLFVGGLDGSDISILSYLDEEENLNKEVEIIEEEKEIEKLNDYFRGEIWTNDIGQKRLDDNFDTFARKINELIDVINDMRDKEC